MVKRKKQQKVEPPEVSASEVTPSEVTPSEVTAPTPNQQSGLSDLELNKMRLREEQDALAWKKILNSLREQDLTLQDLAFDQPDLLFPEVTDTTLLTHQLLLNQTVIRRGQGENPEDVLYGVLNEMRHALDLYEKIYVKRR